MVGAQAQQQNFNSIKVRLERNYGAKGQRRFGYFNSIKVRLELEQSKVGRLYNTYFNSIKVRLELSEECLRQSIRIFQFHKGTIRTTFKKITPES